MYWAPSNSFSEWEIWKVSGMTVTALDKTRDGTPGYVLLILARHQVLRHFGLLMDDLRANDMAKSVVEDLDALLQHTRNYGTYEHAFPASEGGDSVETYKNKHKNEDRTDCDGLRLRLARRGPRRCPPCGHQGERHDNQGHELGYHRPCPFERGVTPLELAAGGGAERSRCATGLVQGVAAVRLRLQ